MTSKQRLDELSRDLLKQFLKTELMSICEELGIQGITTDTTARFMIKKINDDMYVNGVPELDGISELLGEYLVAAEICAVNGDILLEPEEEGNEGAEPEPQPTKAIVPQKGLPEKLPECFSFQDDLDPACAKCLVKAQCKIARIQARPPCFGVQYFKHDPQCQICLEALACSVELAKKPVVKKTKPEIYVEE